MINEPPLFKGLSIKTPVTLPVKGRGFIYDGFGLHAKAGSLPRSPKCKERSGAMKIALKVSSEEELCDFHTRADKRDVSCYTVPGLRLWVLPEVFRTWRLIVEEHGHVYLFCQLGGSCG